jgi:hypothetical protein
MTPPTDELCATLPCHGCGYDLRAHPPDGKCPECGASVAESRRVAGIPRRSAWRESDARWRRRMLCGAWLLVLLPLVDVVKAFEWGSSVRVPAVFELGSSVRTLDATYLYNLGVYQKVIFCMGVVLLFAKERGRRRGRLDWTRRWGVLCSYVVSLLSGVSVFLISALVLVGLAAVFLSMPSKFQPEVTQSLVGVGAAWLRYGLYPSDASYAASVAFSSIAILLACSALFDALRSCGPRVLAAILLAPLALFSLMHLAQVARYCLGPSDESEAGIYWLGMYFRPQLLVSHIAGHPTEWGLSQFEFSDFLVEAVKWCAVFGIAVWLSVAQVLAWRKPLGVLRRP